MHHTHFLVLVALTTASLFAQTPEGAPVEHTLRIAPGAMVDLDTGFQLPSRKIKPHAADLKFDRDGAGFYLLPYVAAQPAKALAERPERDWSEERQGLGIRDEKPHTFFVRTDRGCVARVTIAIADPYSTASAVLRWAIAPPAMPVFLSGPNELRCEWQGQALAIDWSGDAPRWLIELEHGEQVRKLSCDKPPLRIEELDPAGVYQLRVRGLYRGGEVSLPAEVVQFGSTRPATRGIVTYPDRWYDTSGGLLLSTGERANEAAEVVFYLYGVYVPGGGVQRLGKGADCFRMASALPETGYLPSYGRLDDQDVLAVRLADGRFGCLWLEPTKASDVRSGMQVHFTFLADGRRHLLPTPSNPRSELTAGGVKLQWDAVPGASSYRVLPPGAAKPTEVKDTEILLAGLPAESFQTVQLTSVAVTGDESEPLPFEVSVFGPGYRLGSFQLDASGKQGFDFATDAPAAAGAAADLRITNSAGGASSLTFASATGIAAGKDLTFGAFTAAGPLDFGPSLSTDDRNPGADLMFVKTAEGGLASIRIKKRNYPVSEFTYVYRLPGAVIPGAAKPGAAIPATEKRR